MTENQVVSKQRVIDSGEVYTAAREVNAMLDLVKQETERIDSRFLEPACGTGNFLTEILERKLRVVAARYARSRSDYERYALLAVSSIYGIDKLEDNVQACRERLFAIFDQAYTGLFKGRSTDKCRDAVKYILGRNIIWGDALSLETAGEDAQPIVFSEWALVRGSMFKRRDFAFHELLPSDEARERTLFGELEGHFVSDLGEPVFIPTPVKEYPMTHYLRLADADRR